MERMRAEVCIDCKETEEAAAGERQEESGSAWRQAGNKSLPLETIDGL